MFVAGCKGLVTYDKWQVRSHRIRHPLCPAHTFWAPCLQPVSNQKKGGINRGPFLTGGWQSKERSIEKHSFDIKTSPCSPLHTYSVMVRAAMTQSNIKCPKPRVILFALLHLGYNSPTWEPVSHQHCKRAKKYVMVWLNSNAPDISVSQKDISCPCWDSVTETVNTFLTLRQLFWVSGRGCFPFLAKVKPWQRHILVN